MRKATSKQTCRHTYVHTYMHTCIYTDRQTDKLRRHLHHYPVLRCTARVFGVQTVLIPDHSSSNSLPIRIRLTFSVTGNGSDAGAMPPRMLDLERNDRVKPTAPVVIGDDHNSVAPLHPSYPNVSSFVCEDDVLLLYLHAKIISRRVSLFCFVSRITTTLA